MNYINLVEKVLKKCIRLGADNAEVYLQAGRNLSVQVLNSEIETIEDASSQGAGFRIFTGNRMGFSHCNNFSDKAVEETILKALEFAKLSTPDEYNVLTDDNTISEVTGLYDPEIESVPIDNKIKIALELEKAALKDARITKSSGAGYRERYIEIFIANSRGIFKNYKTSSCSLGVSVVAEKGDQKTTGSESCSRIFFEELLPVEEIGALAARKAYEMLDPVMVKTQKAAVIFDADAGRALLGGIISAVNGERVLQGASFLRNSLGQRIASSLLTIVDDGIKPKGLASCPFDGEGVPTMKNIIVEEGVLKSFIYNMRAAIRAGVKSTGNASRGEFSSLPGIGVHNIYLVAGKSLRNEIIASTREGFLVKEVTGYGIDPVSGNFSGGASGFWIREGQIAYPVRGLTIAGRADVILNAIDLMGNDVDMNRSFATPTFRVAEMQIGGK
ncbi:MAG: TldD/PmbA family protein [Bacteroidales bacterium]